MSRKLVEVFPVGEHLADELEARHWSQSDFAQILDRPAQFVSEIISGKKEVTRESAAQIGAALGTGAEYWLNLQNIYLLHAQGQNGKTRQQLSEVRLRARMNELAPIGLLLKRGLISGTTPVEQEAELLELFQINDIQDEPTFLAAARRSNASEDTTPTQKAWLACARKLAQQRPADSFNEQGLKLLAGKLSGIVTDPTQFEGLPKRFADVGVRLVYVEAFPSSKMNGAAFLLEGDPDKPVIALSGRGKRLDNVLFTLLHEVAHVALGHVSGDKLVIDEGHESSEDAHEQEADRQAGEWQIPGSLPEPPAIIRKGWVQTVAAEIGVHPVVIIGRLQNEKKLDWRTALVKGAPTVDDYLARW